jgi:hypothetical protein
MRRWWLLAGALALGAANPVSAQVKLTNFGASNGTNTRTTNPTGTGLSQMLPKINTAAALGGTPGNPRVFNFSKMLPSFSFLRGGFGPRVGPSILPSFGTLGQKK